MTERAVTDSSPLIILARIEQLDLLRLISDQIIVPAAVAREIEQHGADDVAARALRHHDWLIRVPPRPLSSTVATVRLGRGESEVLAWAIEHPGSIAILDDRAARRAARHLGVPMRGTLGVIVHARQRGVLAAARPVAYAARAAGLYLSTVTIESALQFVGE